MTSKNMETQALAVNSHHFQNRRERLMEELPENSVALVATAPEAVRSADTYYPYRQNSHFLYLTGFQEPEAVLALVVDRDQTQSVLFCRNKNSSLEQWTGERLGPNQAPQILGVDQAFPVEEINQRLPELLRNKQHLYYSMSRTSGLQKSVQTWVGKLQSGDSRTKPKNHVNLDILLDELRLRKSSEEIAVMRRAGWITAQAHKRAMQACRAGLSEARLEAEILHEFALHGARYPAYTSIVGSGKNACILHYIDNNDLLTDGDLVLIDAGCELQGYAADLTRTFPVNGRFSPHQRSLYEIVLSAQQAAISEARAEVHYQNMQKASDGVLTEGLIDLGILKGNAGDLIEEQAALPFSVHRVGHWLGLDVHDVGDYDIEGHPRVLEPGMVTTVEPGLYIPADCQQAPEALRGTGIRIEDSVLITDGEPDILTADVPKTVSEIEALMRA